MIATVGFALFGSGALVAIVAVLTALWCSVLTGSFPSASSWLAYVAAGGLTVQVAGICMFVVDLVTESAQKLSQGGETR